MFMKGKNLATALAEINKATKKTRDFINSIVDENSFVETDTFLSSKAFDENEAIGEGVICGYATFNGNPVQIFAQNPDVLKGSLSKAQALKIEKCMDRAIESLTPLISIIDSCGARVGDGVSILEGYASILRKADFLKESVPHICVVNGVSVGLTSAYVASADFVFMAKDAVMSLNSPMYLVSDAKTFPVDYKKALGYEAYAKNSTMAQFTYKDAKDLQAKLDTLFDTVYTEDNDSEDDPNRVNPELVNADAFAVAKDIVDAGTLLEYAPEYANDVLCAFAKINGLPVAVLATKGDYMSSEALDKATEFAKLVYKVDVDLITLVDTKGINSNLSQELAGYAKKAYSFISAISNIETNKIGVAVGNAFGFGYTALMSKGVGFGYTLATEGAKISPVAEEVAVAMMADQLKAQDRNDNIEKLSKEYAEMQEDPIKVAKEGYLDNVVEATNLRPYLASALMMLKGI